MPAVPFIAAALGASGALAAGGAALASVIGISGISTAAATAIGAGAFAGLSTAVQGGGASDVLKSAVLGGITSYAGSAIAGSIGKSVADAAKGLDPGIASAMGKVAGSAVAGAISSGTSALLSGKDPIEALLKGGLTAAMSATVGAGVDALLKDVPALSTPLNSQEAALQRATRAAIGTAIASGGDADAIGRSILNSFVTTAGETIGKQIRDTGADLSAANEQFRTSEREYTNNLEQQNKLVADYNSQIAPLQQSADKVNGLIKQYDEAAKNYNNYDSWMKSQGYEERTYTADDGGWGNAWVKQVYRPERQVAAVDDFGYSFTYTVPAGYGEEPAPTSMSKEALLEKAKSLDAQAVAEANKFTELKNKLLGGEITKYKTEVKYETTYIYDWDGNAYPQTTAVEVQVPYKEKVEGSLTPIEKQLQELKDKVDPLEKSLVESKTNLENAVAQFNTVETENTARVKSEIDNFITASKQYKDEFGVEPTEEQLKTFASSGDILGTVSRLVADSNNEQTAKEAGYENYADYTAAGNISPKDYYAKQQGWQDYAQQLNAQANGYKTPDEWNTYTSNQQTAVNNGFANYQDYQAAEGAPSNDFYAKKEGWENYAQKQQAEESGFKNPTLWNTHVVDVKNQESARAEGFPDYDTQIRFGNNVDEYNAVQEGWQNLTEKEVAAKYEITDPKKYEEFVSGKTEEDKVVQMLKDRGIPATPERVAAVMDKWDFNPTTPNVGFGDALSQSDKINIANSRADSVQEAAALAKSLGYSNFSFGGSEYKLNTAAPGQNPYDFFANFGEAYKAARADLGAGKNFEWTNPATGETKTFNTNNDKEQAVADQKRIDLMPAYTGEGAYTRTGNPGVVDNVFVNKKSGDVVEDTRVWDAMGNVVSGELKSVTPGTDSAAGRVATAINEGIGKAAKAYIDVASGVVKGGASLLNQVGVLGGMTGLVNMDNWATQTAASINKQIDGLKSDEFKNNQKLLNDAINKAGDAGFVAQAIEAAKQFGSSPIQTAEFIAANGPSMLIGGGAMAAARALGAGMKVAEAAAIGTMAATQGASVADEAYKDAIKNGKSEEEALNSARVAWAGASLTSAVANKFIPGALSNEAAIAARGIAKTSISNALKGEMSSELAEEVSGKVIGNIAAGNAWDKDLGSTAVQALIGSGVVTGLTQVAATSSPETAVAIAKDAGITDAQINDIKNSFKNSLGIENYNPAQAKEQLDALLSGSNLSPEVAEQVGDLIGTTAIKNAIGPTLEKAGVPAAYVDSLANLTATQIYNNESPATAFENVATVLQASGFDPQTANLITNQTLTGTDVKQVVTDQLKAAGYTATQAEIDNLISRNATAKAADIASSVSGYTGPRIVTKEEAKTSLAAAGVSNPTEAQINALIGQYDQNLLQSRANTTAGDISTQLASAEKASFDRDAALSKTLNDISAQVTANQNAGMNADQALNQAITQVATSVGSTKDDLLKQIGQTEQGLKDQITGLQQKSSEDISGVKTQLGVVESTLSDKIAANEAAGMARDEAIEKAVTEVAQSVGQSKSDLLALIGKTQENLTQQYASGQLQLENKLSTLDEASQQRYQALSDAQKLQAASMAQQGKDLTQAISDVSTASQQQIAGVETKLSAAIESAKAAGLAGDEALQSAINSVAGDLGVTKSDLLTQMGKTEEGLRQELATQVGGVRTDVAALQAQLNDQGKSLLAQLTQQGVDYGTALQQAVAAQQQQVTDVQKSLTDAMAANEAAGLSRDQATAKAIEDVATSLGTTKDALLTRLGTTEGQLRSEMQAGQALTASQIAGLESQLTEQGRSLVSQLQQQGVSYQQALSDAIAAQNAQITAGQQQTAEQIASVKDSLTAQITANEAAGLSRDEATNKAINDLSTQMGVDKQTLMSQLGTTEQALRTELQSGLADVTKTFQDQYNALSAAQKAQFDAMVEQGASTQAALAQVQASLQEQITTGQEQTAQQIAALNTSLSDKIAANEAAGLSRNDAINKAVQDVATSVGTTKDALLAQLGQTEAGLQQQFAAGQAQTQEQIAQLDAATQAKFEQMTEAQKAQALQLAQTTKDLQGSINTVAEQTAQQIAGVSTDLQAKLAASDAATQAAFAQMTTAQQAEAAARVQQGQDLRSAIAASQQATQEQITGGLAALSQDFQTKLAASDTATQAAFAQMSAAQQAEAAARVQQGQDLQGAIAASSATAAQQLAQAQAALEGQLSAQGKQFFDALRQQGVDYNSALNQAMEAQSQQFTAGQQALTNQIGALSEASQQQYANLNAAQQQEVAARVAQGESLQNALTSVQENISQQLAQQAQQTQQQISGLSTQTQAQYQALNDAQRKEVQDRVAQGQGLESAIGGVSGQLSSLQQQFEAEKRAEEAYRREQEEKARQDAAKAAAASTAARVNAANQSRMAAQSSVLAGLAGLTGAAAAPDEEFKPLQGTFLTSKGGETGYKGLLQDFQQEVEGQPNMADNRMGRQESNDMAPYYSYGSETSLDQILGQDNAQQQFFASGGLATPLMAAGGTTGTRYGKYAAGGMPSPLMAAGGKMRVDFRRGDAVTGPGDGQSDDIPAMLADGEFVFPADVVAAIGNGSTKAGSDKLYDMMHSIRAHVRSAKPKDLPPEIKSPLDFLKTSKKRRA